MPLKEHGSADLATYLLECRLLQYMGMARPFEQKTPSTTQFLIEICWGVAVGLILRTLCCIPSSPFCRARGTSQRRATGEPFAGAREGDTWMAWCRRRAFHTLRSTYWRWSLPGVGKELARAGGAEAARPSRTDGVLGSAMCNESCAFPFDTNTRVDRSRFEIDHCVDRFAGSWLCCTVVLVHVLFTNIAK